jgi:Domain of unknown function (DUF4276)
LILLLEMQVAIAAEGSTDLTVLKILLAKIGLASYADIACSGKADFNAKLADWNRSARHSPWVVLRDLDHDAACANDLIKAILPKRNNQLYLRIAVRQIEAWLLADRDSIAAFLHISVARITDDPDALDNPKQALVNLARKSRNRDIREGMVPEIGLSSTIGSEYTAQLTSYASNVWRPAEARKNSPSLARTMARLEADFPGLTSHPRPARTSY